jgi:hypothetical protein
MSKPIKLPTTLEDANKLLIEVIKIAGVLAHTSCQCDRGHDGRGELRGPYCERCKNWDRWQELRFALVIDEKPPDFQI